MKKLLLVLIAFCVLSPAGAVLAEGEPALTIEIFCKPGENRMNISNHTWADADVRFEPGYPEGTSTGRLSHEASELLENGLEGYYKEKITSVCGEFVNTDLAEDAVKVWAEKVLDYRAGLAMVIVLNPAEPPQKTDDNRDTIWSEWGYPASRNLIGPKHLYWQEDTNITVIYSEQGPFEKFLGSIFFFFYALASFGIDLINAHKVPVY